MKQSKFNNYQLATSDAYVKLTRQLVNDIASGNRTPTLNGCKVVLREKVLAVCFLKIYTTIIQEHTLTDIADQDINRNPVDNRMSRNEMKDLLSVINRITNLGLNSSEDFVLDR